MFAFHSGWRRGEMFGLRWEQVDMNVDPPEATLWKTKNGRTRSLPLVGELGEVIRRRWDARIVRRRNQPTVESEYVFHYWGRPLGNVSRVWRKSADRAGLPGVLLHDMRRSAARNMSRAGVPQHVAMEVTGHRDVGMFRRYCICDESMKADALRRTMEASAERAGRIIPFDGQRRRQA